MSNCLATVYALSVSARPRGHARRAASAQPGSSSATASHYARGPALRPRARRSPSQYRKWQEPTRPPSADKSAREGADIDVRYITMHFRSERIASCSAS